MSMNEQRCSHLVEVNAQVKGIESQVDFCVECSDDFKDHLLHVSSLSVNSCRFHVALLHVNEQQIQLTVLYHVNSV